MDLVVDNLSCARGGIHVIEGVSFTLPAGGVLVLRGPNGCGKTTLLRTLAGLQPAEQGEVSAPPDSIAYAAHADGIKPALSVTENLSFWAHVHGLRDIVPALDALNLRELAARPAQNLSAGQKRRLGLARLMVTGRPIWLLDEPTVSLDLASVTLFIDLMRAHLAAGGSAVIATHIELGLSEARVLQLEQYRAHPRITGEFDEAFA